jgi:hypothetical protein
MDMYTECVAIGIAANMRPDFRSVMQMKHAGSCDGLRRFLADPDGAPLEIYGRYWQGYQIIMRPLLLFFSYDKVRVIVGITSMLLTLCFFYVLSGRTSKKAALFVFLAFCMTMNARVFFLVTYGVQYWLVIAAAIGVLQASPRYAERLPLIFAVIGGTDAYFTFLNLPSLSLSVPLLCWFLRELATNNFNGEKLIARAFLCCLAWAAAMVLVWVCKWLLLRYIQGDWNFFGTTLDYYPLGSRWPLDALIHCFIKTQFMALLVISGFLLCLKKRRKIKNSLQTRVLIFPALIPVLWIELAMPGHAAQHVIMLSFALWPSFATVLFLIYSPLPPKADINNA